MLGHLQGHAHPVNLRGQRPDRLLLVAQSPKLRNVPDNLAVLPPDRLLVALLSLQGLAELAVLGLQRSEPVLLGAGGRCRRLGKGLRKLLAQTRHFPMQSGGACPDLAAELLRLFDGRVELATADREPRLPRTGIATGGYFRPAQPLAARLRPRPPAPVPARTAIASRAVRMSVQRGKSKPPRGSRSASALRQNQCRESPCARR